MGNRMALTGHSESDLKLLKKNYFRQSAKRLKIKQRVIFLKVLAGFQQKKFTIYFQHLGNLLKANFLSIFFTVSVVFILLATPNASNKFYFLPEFLNGNSIEKNSSYCRY